VIVQFAGFEVQFEAIIVEARNHVYVVVHDLLTCSRTVVLQDVDTLCTSHLLDGYSDLLGGYSDCAQNLVRNIEDVGVGLLGNHEGMSLFDISNIKTHIRGNVKLYVALEGGNWTYAIGREDVQKREHMFVFVEFVAGNRTSNDLLKDGLRHGGLRG